MHGTKAGEEANVPRSEQNICPKKSTAWPPCAQGVRVVASLTQAVSWLSLVPVCQSLSREGREAHNAGLPISLFTHFGLFLQ